VLDLLVPGLYAWGVTVAGPVSHRLASLSSRIFALIALVALVAGAALRVNAPSIARVIGIWVFLGSSVAAWASVGSPVTPAQLDPVQGTVGAVGWALFAIAWAAAKKPTNAPAEPSPVAAQPAVPRKRLPPSTPFLLAAVVVAACVPMAFAWGVENVERALLAHAISLAAAIALIAFATDALDPRLRRGDGAVGAVRPERRIVDAAPALVALALVALAGAAYSLLR
jgi:hypothetical protein